MYCSFALHPYQKDQSFWLYIFTETTKYNTIYIKGSKKSYMFGNYIHKHGFIGFEIWRQILG